MKSLVVVAGLLLTGCATRAPRPTCGIGWSPLTVERAPERHVTIDRPDTAIDHVEIAGVDRHLADTLRRELQVKPGMTISDAPIGDDIRRLWKLGVVADIAVELRGATLTYVVEPRPTIASVVPLGGDTLAQARFRRLAATSFEPARVRRMTEALRESYIRDGRLDAKVEAKHRVRPNGVEVCVALDPGPRITIAKLRFPGSKAIPEKTLAATMYSKKVNHVGGTYDESALEYDKLYILAAYWDRGYANVAVREPKVQRRGKKLEVSLPIDEGPLFHLGGITATHGLPVPLVKRGDLFSRTQVATAREQLEKLPGVYTVLPLTRVDLEARTIDVNFAIEWRWPWDALRAWLSRSR